MGNIIHSGRVPTYGTQVANELRKWIEESKETYLNAEEEVTRVTPTLFLEYAEAGDEARQDYTVYISIVCTLP